MFLALLGLRCKICKRCILTFARDDSRAGVLYEPSVCKRIQDSISVAQTVKLFTEALYKLIKYKVLAGHEEKEEKN